MNWKQVVLIMVMVPLISVTLLITTPAFMYFSSNTDTDLERTVVPTISLLIIHIALVVAPGIISIAVILYRSRLSYDRVMSIQSKVTVIMLCAWTIFVCFVGLGPTISV